MTEEELKEFIKSKREPIMSCKDLAKHFIGRHKNIPVYLAPSFETEFNYKMTKLEQLQQENEELKKQLENCYCNRTDCSSRLKNSKKYDSLVQKVEKQQKEFIKYLEYCINELKKERMNKFENTLSLAIADVTKIILEEYKEIIGFENANK